MTTIVEQHTWLCITSFIGAVVIMYKLFGPILARWFSGQKKFDSYIIEIATPVVENIITKRESSFTQKLKPVIYEAINSSKEYMEIRGALDKFESKSAIDQLERENLKASVARIESTMAANFNKLEGKLDKVIERELHR